MKTLKKPAGQSFDPNDFYWLRSRQKKIAGCETSGLVLKPLLCVEDTRRLNSDRTFNAEKNDGFNLARSSSIRLLSKMRLHRTPKYPVACEPTLSSWENLSFFYGL